MTVKTSAKIGVKEKKAQIDLSIFPERTTD